MTIWIVLGLVALVASLLFLVVYLAQKRGEANAEKDVADDASIAIAQAAAARRTAEDAVRAAGDGTASDSVLEPWFRD